MVEEGRVVVVVAVVVVVVEDVAGEVGGLDVVGGPEGGGLDVVGALEGVVAARLDGPG